MIRNHCPQCGEPYLNVEWRATRACGPTHAAMAVTLSNTVRRAIDAMIDAQVELQAADNHVWGRPTFIPPMPRRRR